MSRNIRRKISGFCSVSVKKRRIHLDLWRFSSREIFFLTLVLIILDSENPEQHIERNRLDRLIATAFSGEFRKGRGGVF